MKTKLILFFLSLLVLGGCFSNRDNDQEFELQESEEPKKMIDLRERNNQLNQDNKPIDIHKEKQCLTDEECLPKPGCHAKECINKTAEADYPKPDVCTEEFNCQAAYKPSDCICGEGECLNINLHKQNCE
jgi:hypothetical protein